LLFADHGLSVRQVSSLFIIWSLTAFVFELPSGAWADTVDRRLLLVVSAGIYALGFSAWMLAPTYLGFATGFVLWGLSGAIMSGTFEALLYDELAARGAEEQYARVVGWSHSAAMVANLVASVAAAPLYALGGYVLVGWTSVTIAGVQAVLAASLPVTKHHQAASVEAVPSATESLATRYVAMLRAGLREASRAVDVRRVVLITAALVGLTAYDEYFAFIAREGGVTTAVVPWLVGLAVLGQAIGTALAGRTAGMSSATMAGAVVAGGALISLGALVSPVLGFVAIATGYGLLNNTMIVSEARLQQVIKGPARATVTSVTGLATEVVALAVYAGFGVAAGLASVSTLVALLGIPVVVMGACVARWLPAPRLPEV
jgi:MFS family permease